MIGTDGGIYHDGMRPNSPKLYPEEKWTEYKTDTTKRVPKTLPRTKGIHRDWIAAMKEGRKSCSDFSYAAPLSEVIVLGTLAIRTGKTVEWDYESQQIKGNDEAAKLINVQARAGWDIKDLKA